jgi:hypothetical protein
LAEKALFAVAALVTLAALAELIGTKDILGAFIAGIALNRTLKGREDLLEHLIFAGRMLFIPFFFIQTGMKLELAVFGEIRPWVMAALLVATVLAGKTAAAWMTGHRFGYGRTDRLGDDRHDHPAGRRDACGHHDRRRSGPDRRDRGRRGDRRDLHHLPDRRAADPGHRSPPRRGGTVPARKRRPGPRAGAVEPMVTDAGAATPPLKPRSCGRLPAGSGDVHSAHRRANP